MTMMSYKRFGKKSFLILLLEMLQKFRKQLLELDLCKKLKMDRLIVSDLNFGSQVTKRRAQIMTKLEDI